MTRRAKIAKRRRRKAPSPGALRAPPSPARGEGARSRRRGKAPSKQTNKPSTPSKQATRWPADIKFGKIVKRTDMGDVAGLARSIDARGALLAPIVIDGGNHLIAGQRRLAAWVLTEKFHDAPIPVHVVDIDSILAGEWDENSQRKDFTPSEAVALMEALLPQAKAAAKARQAQKGSLPPAADVFGRKGQALDHLAHYLGRDRKTIGKAKEVVDAARADPEQFGALVAAMDRSGNVNGPWRRLQVHMQVADIAAKKASGELDLPAGRYDRIVADPPWPFELDDAAPAARGRAVRGYATLSIAELEAMPIKRRLAKNCVVYCWTTNYHMEAAYRVLRAWGLTEFPTILTWVKDRIGRGQRLREQTEHCIVAVRGQPVWQLDAQSTRLDAPVREDARKPDEFYALIDALTPAQRSLELFARRELPAHWDGFGDQVGTFKDAAGKNPAAGAAEPYVRAARPDAAQNALIDAALDAGHQIAMTIDHVDAGKSFSVATCACGWISRARRTGAEHARIDADVNAHWRDVVATGSQAA